MNSLLLFAAFGSSPEPDFSAFTPPTKMEYRMIDGRVYHVPAGSSWTVPSSPPLNCPNGRCTPSQ